MPGCIPQALAVEREHFDSLHQAGDAILTDYSGGLAQRQGAQIVPEVDEAAASELLTQIAQPAYSGVGDLWDVISFPSSFDRCGTRHA